MSIHPSWRLVVVYLFYLLTICWCAEFKFDVILKDPNPLVGSSSAEEYRIYVTWEYREATVSEIGRTVNTGTGLVGNGYRFPEIGNEVPNESGLPSGTRVTAKNSESANWRRLEFKFPSGAAGNVGVFYATTIYNKEEITILTVKTSESATIKQHRYSVTTSIGESVTLRVTTAKTILRWMHNGERRIPEWNDQKAVTITNVRLADAGIYECFENGRREEGKHAIMRLIVRGCPAAKHGLNCEHTCRTCWNGGVCEQETGICICPPGFQGEQCETACGDSNYWGAQCSLYCTGTNPRPDGCRTILFCGPDPIGCACVAGFSGLDCDRECPLGRYGANCDGVCHCPDSDCNPATGCQSDTCHDGYQSYACQEQTQCSSGYFGELCQYRCHCEGGADCNKVTGRCTNEMCASGWAGSDCQQALPAIYRHPIVNDVYGSDVTVGWYTWRKDVDYGRGPVYQYRVYYGMQGDDRMQYVDTYNVVQKIDNLLPETTYDFAIAVIKIMGGSPAVGMMSSHVTALTGCTAPQKVRNLKAESISTSSVLVSWDESRCIISGVTVRYRLLEQDQCMNAKGMSIVENTDRLNTTIGGLESYSTYSISVFETSGNQLGDEEQLVIATMETAPTGSPTNVKYTYNKDQLRISFKWKPPPCGQRHGDILNYEYEFRQLLSNATFSDTLSGTTDNPSTSFLDIQPDMVCSFRVRASTPKGDGPFTTWEHYVAVESSPNYLLIAITVPVSIVAVTVIFAVVAFLICSKKCTFLNCTNKSGEDTSRLSISAKSHSSEEKGHDNDGYVDMNRSTLEPTHHYVEPDHHYLKPMTPRSMKAKKAKKHSSKKNKGSKKRVDSETYEDIDVQADGDHSINNTDDEKRLRHSKKYESVKF